MRPMDIDPTFIPYLDQVVASRPIPIHQEDVALRRPRIAELRRKTAAPIPPDVRVENWTVPTQAGEFPVRIYWPRGEGVKPCIIYYHGGGWMYGSPEQSDGTSVRLCQNTGAVIVSPEYRLTPERRFPDAFDDCYDTLLWTAENAARLGIDPGRVAVTGESCGGNLSAACSLQARDANGPSISLQVLLYPMLGTDFETVSYRENADAPIISRDESIYFWDNYLADEMDKRDQRAVPLCAEDFSNLPPAYIVTAEYAPLRDDGARYAEKLSAAGTPAELHNAERLPHGFLGAWSVSDDAGQVGEAICSAFRRAFAA